MALVSQRLEAPKTWLGSDKTNVLRVVCDLLDLVQRMNTQLTIHTHGPTQPPANAEEFLNNAAFTVMLKTDLEKITL